MPGDFLFCTSPLHDNGGRDGDLNVIGLLSTASLIFGFFG
jgi:hypothetical protein